MYMARWRTSRRGSNEYVIALDPQERGAKDLFRLVSMDSKLGWNRCWPFR